jgi:23S rRNA (uracil1939-C5)-methyltransferase
VVQRRLSFSHRGGKNGSRPVAAQRIDCPHVPPCGGCPLIALDLEAQALRKRAVVEDALRRFPALAGVEVAPLLRAPAATGYRTRAKLAVSGARVGLYATGTHDVVDIPGCRVLAPGLVAVAEVVRGALRAAADGRAGALRHVDLRWSRAQGQAHVSLVVEAPTRPPAPGEAARAGPPGVPLADGPPWLAELAAALMHSPLVAGVGARETGRGPTPRALAGETRHLAGEPTLLERFGGVTFRLSPGTFFQADPGAAELLLPLLAAHLADGAPGEHLWDLYAGAGALAIPLWRVGAAACVTAIESVAAAVADGRAAVAGTAPTGDSAAAGQADVRFAEARVEDMLGEELPAERPDRVILDPPRRGVPAGVLAAVAALGAPRVAYVSCAPLTLARDLDVLRLHGVRAVRVVPIDLFSLTDEVEAVALLEPGPLPPPEVVWQGRDVLCVNKPASLSTEFPPGRSLVARVRALPGGAGAGMSPVHRLDRGTSGLLLFARGDALRRLGAALEARTLHKEYLALVRGIPHQKGKVDRALRDRTDGRERAATTRYVRERVVGGHALLRLRLETGRFHQIRRHLAGIGHPVVGDARHGHPPTNRHFAESLLLARPFLHAAVLTLPAEAAGGSSRGAPLRLEAPLPPELRLVLEQLEAREARGARS